jgi:hypothetical protein
MKKQHAQNEVARPFLWRDRHGERHLPAHMETRHLFYTLRMIWNNTMPASARLPGNLYSFGPTYTREYMLGAIVAIVPELATRKNMTPEWRQQLQHMIDWISIYQLKSEKRAQIEEAA